MGGWLQNLCEKAKAEHMIPTEEDVPLLWMPHSRVVYDTHQATVQKANLRGLLGMCMLIAASIPLLLLMRWAITLKIHWDRVEAGLRAQLKAILQRRDANRWECV